MELNLSPQAQLTIDLSYAMASLNSQQANKSTLLSILERDKEEHIVLLQKFIQAPSPNPPGDTRAAAKVVTDYLEAKGINFEILSPGGEELPNIVSSFVVPLAGTGGGMTRSKGKNIVLNGHLDVFPVDTKEVWKHGGPWSGHYEKTGEGKGFVYGRGGVDMKAGTLASVIAFTYLHHFLSSTLTSVTRTSGSACHTVTLTAVSDEETGGKFGSKYLLFSDERREQWRGDVMLNAEPGGMESIRFAEKGTLRITFIVRTPGAHGAYLHLSEGANRVAARLITALLSVEKLEPPDLPKEIKEFVLRKEVRDAMDTVMGKGAGSLALRPTVNVGVVQGGVKVNTIPSRCEVQVDIRLPIGLTKEVVLLHINEKVLSHFPEVEMRVQEAASNPSSWCDPQHELVGIVKHNAEVEANRGRDEKEERLTVTPIPSLGATDTKFWRYASVPAYVYGVSPETMAAVDERVRVEEFLRIIKVHAAAVWDYLGFQ